VEKPFRHILICLALTGASVLVAASPAAAGDVVRNDGKDTRGPLDLASVRLTAMTKSDRIAVTTKAPISARQLDGAKGWIEVDFDTNADRQVDTWVAMYFVRSRLRAVQMRGNNVVRQLSARRDGPKKVLFDIRRSNLGTMKSYDFAVFSIWNGKPCTTKHSCVDGIPNRFPLLRNDFTAPTITWGTLPTLSTDVSPNPTFDVGFSIADDPNGSGVKSWTLEQQQDGGSWMQAAAGTGATPPPPSVTGVEGEVTSVRVIAVDRQGNTRTSSIETVIVPWDDQNADNFFTYTVQTPTALTGVTGAFRGTVSELPLGTIVTATLPAGSDVCVLGGPTGVGTTGSIDVRVDGSKVGVMNEDETTAARDTKCVGASTHGGSTLELEVTSTDAFIFDGLAVIR
jgi:hypothetical protein